MIPQDNRRIESLVDILINLVIEKIGVQVKTLVGHRFPDDDVWLCCWMARRFIPSAADAEIVFVNAGTSLPGSENDPSVIHFDTGGGEFDQHTQERGRTSSAAILAEKLDLLKDPGLKELVEMVTKVDNVEPLPPISLHYLIEGYPRLERFRTDGHTDWSKVQEQVFDDFDIIYGQETQRAQSRKDLQKYAVWTILPNGLRVVSLLWNPQLRDAAFEKGADVVLWTIRKGQNRFYVGIQQNRKLKGLLSLRGIAMHLRKAEARLRNIQVTDQRDLNYVGQKGPVTNWFLHQSLALVLCGSRSHKLAEDGYTKIRPRDLIESVLRPLSAIPWDQVTKWRQSHAS